MEKLKKKEKKRKTTQSAEAVEYNDCIYTSLERSMTPQTSVLYIITI